MSNVRFTKVPEEKAKVIASRTQLPDAAIPLLRDEMKPADYIETLLSHKQYVAGIDFMANALPTREAVWWACLCIQYAFGESLAGKDRDACRAATAWVLQPTAENQVVARAPGDAAGPASAAGAAALAASIAGATGSFTSAKAVANSVKLSSIRCDPAKIADTQRLLIGLAIGIAEGRHM